VGCSLEYHPRDLDGLDQREHSAEILPAIFRGVNIDPLTSFQYFLWVLFGYMVVTASLLVMFGRISDMHGRVRLYNLGFAIFTAGSILLYLTPNTGDLVHL
jgi:MFS family permease